MKKTLIALSALLLMGSSAMASSLAQIEAATTLLYSNGVAQCSTQFIDEGILLTANHCVTGGNLSVHSQQFTEDGKLSVDTIYFADILVQDTDRDIAVLKLRAEDHAWKGVYVDLNVAVPLQWGDPLIGVGYPGSNYQPNNKLYITSGKFLEVGPALMGFVAGEFYYTTVPIYYGMSGGGLYKETTPGDYTLIGVASQADPDMRHLSSLWVVQASIEWALEYLPESP